MERSPNAVSLSTQVLTKMPNALAAALPPVSRPQLPGDTTASCTFCMLDAEWVRAFKGDKLPFFRELRAEHPRALRQVTITYAEVVQGTHVETTLSLSHRWMQPLVPDPDGVQLKALKEHLNSAAGKTVSRVWIDAQCMPQDIPEGLRSAEDTASFKTMLKEINMLFLGTQVLILLDLSYVSRFWVRITRTNHAHPQNPSGAAESSAPASL